MAAPRMPQPNSVDEEWVEHRVDDDGVDGRIHRLARVARGAQHGVQSQVHVGDDIAPQDDGHVFAGIADRRVARPEEVEDGVEEIQSGQTEQNADD